MREFLIFCKNKKIFVAVIIMVMFLSMGALYKSSLMRDELFIMEEDVLKGVNTAAANQGVSLSIKAVQDGVEVEREVIVKQRKDTEDKSNLNYSLTREDEINTEITRMIRELNQREEGILSLPEYIGDDTKLEWKRTDSKSTWMLPLIFPPLLLLFMYRSEKDEVKQTERKEAETIVNELPSFNNKLVLLLGSGLVYEESLRRIADTGVPKGKSVLQGLLDEVVREAEATNRDATKLLNDVARKKKISELKRMTTIIMDNQKKGTDLRSKLVLEGELLWDKRKKRAEEQGRISESKLTLPLGIMLISLLIVTAGPALMQM